MFIFPAIFSYKNVKENYRLQQNVFICIQIYRKITNKTVVVTDLILIYYILEHRLEPFLFKK